MIRPSATVKVKCKYRANGRSGRPLAGVIKGKTLFLKGGGRYLAEGLILLRGVTSSHFENNL